jgi:hypothetical protein
MKRGGKARLPKGWNTKSVASELAYYESQSDEDAAAEIEEGFAKGPEAIVVVPRKLLPAVKALIANAG